MKQRLPLCFCGAVLLSYIHKNVSLSFGNMKATFAKFIDPGKKTPFDDA